MALRKNKTYWKLSLDNPESKRDEYYIFDEIIVKNKELIRKIERLRELIISYCVMIEKNKKVANEILEEIYSLIVSIEKIQYTEFVAFWKVLDITYSVFKKLSAQSKKVILTELLQNYCQRRRRLYDKLGYSNIIVQALYDSGVSRKKGMAGILKIIDIVGKTLGGIKHFQDIKDLESDKEGYFLPDKGDKALFKAFCKKYEIIYQFGKDHQDKRPDIVLKISDHFFITEAKHIKESGGAQDKQIVEAIEFIKYSEDLSSIHYLSFMDGIYFNEFIQAPLQKDAKTSKQKKHIEKHLKNNPNNFFVNTAGIKTLLKDLKRE